jgi:hypothetical protein
MRVGLPHHRRAAAVAALELGPELDAVGIGQVLEGEFGLGEAEFLALIDADRTAHGEQQFGGKAGKGILLAVRGPAADVPHDIVVGEGKADPAFGRIPLS